MAKLIFAIKCSFSFSRDAEGVVPTIYRQRIFSPSHLLFFTGGQTPPLQSTDNASSLPRLLHFFSGGQTPPLQFAGNASSLLSAFFSGRRGRRPLQYAGMYFSPRPTRFNFALCILNFAFAKPTIVTQSVSDTQKADLCGLLFIVKI